MGNAIHLPPQREIYEYDHPNLISINGISALYINNKSESCNVFCHGVRCDLVDIHPYISQLPKNRNHIFFDYPGYGLSLGNISEKNCIKSVKAIVDWVAKSHSSIHLYGHSMGCCILAGFCSKYKWEDPVVMISPFSSIDDLVPLHIGYDTKAYVEEMVCGITFYHGRKDTTIPNSHSEKLAKIHGSILILGDWDHVDILKYVLSTLL